MPEKEESKISAPEMCRVLAFPAIGRQVDDDQWRVEVEGVIYQRREITLRKRMLLRVLHRIMNAEQGSFTSPLFKSRVEAFVAGTEPGHRPEFRLLAGEYRPTRPTLRNGRFTGAVTLDLNSTVQDRTSSAGASQCELQVRLGSNNQAESNTSAFLIPSQGVSLISDIDDTIKLTNVRQRREMLINTFLRPFEVIEGMSDSYRRLADEGVVFHYVSSSPWQLFEPLSRLLVDHEFPAGSIHLRNFRLRDHMLRRVFLLHRRGKGGVIRNLLRMFPNRKFLLVGDSGERDPKIYAGLCRQFPGQVLGILIRVLDPKHEEGLKEKYQDSPHIWERMHLYESADQFEQKCHALLAADPTVT